MYQAIMFSDDFVIANVMTYLLHILLWIILFYSVQYDGPI